MTQPSRVVIVTGSSRSVGLGVADSLLARGDIVIGCSRGPSAITHERYEHFSVDVTDEVAIREMYAQTAAKHGGIDLLVNNAGVSWSRLTMLTSAKDFQEVVRINLVGTFVVSREAIRLMKRKRFGRIVNFSSINVPLASVGGAPYNASKAGVENLAITLSRECAGDDITINSIGISLMQASHMVQGLAPAVLAAKQDALIKPALIGMSELMHVIEFFAAPEARNVTGQIVYFGGVS
jgi:3-oxoacyl-[acyl-carrier protein] reductase